MTNEDVVGLLLAGGLARRMGGGDKPLKELDGRPLLEHVVDRARPQVGDLVLNANGDPARFAHFGLPVVADVVEGFAGPLAGILTGLEWIAEHRPEAAWMMSFATDAPFFPTDMVARLRERAEANDADVACACSGDRTHPVFALWRPRLREDLRVALVEEEMRKIDRWTARYKVEEVAFDADSSGRDPFFNINRPEDLAEAETTL